MKRLFFINPYELLWPILESYVEIENVDRAKQFSNKLLKYNFLNFLNTRFNEQYGQ